MEPTTSAGKDHPPLAVSDYLTVRDRLADLGCVFPDGFAVLPRNFEEAADRESFRLPSEASTVRSLLRNEGLPVSSILPDAEKPQYISLNSFGWLGPTLFVSAGLLSNNATAIQVALGVLTNYVSDFLKSSGKPATIKLDIVVERKADRLCKKISYEGPIEGLQTLAEAVKRVADEA